MRRVRLTRRRICTLSVTIDPARSAGDSSKSAEPTSHALTIRTLIAKAGARHYVTITSPRPYSSRSPTRPVPFRIGGCSSVSGVLHFVAPKPFDTIVPEELPGGATHLPPTPSVGEIASAAAVLLAPKTRRLGALAAVALFVSVFPANVNMVRLWKDQPLPCGWVPIAASAPADPDDHAGAQDLSHTPTRRRRSTARADPSLPGSASGATVCAAAHVVERSAHRFDTAQSCNAAHASRYTAS